MSKLNIPEERVDFSGGNSRYKATFINSELVNDGTLPSYAIEYLCELLDQIDSTEEILSIIQKLKNGEPLTSSEIDVVMLVLDKFHIKYVDELFENQENILKIKVGNSRPNLYITLPSSINATSPRKILIPSGVYDCVKDPEEDLYIVALPTQGGFSEYLYLTDFAINHYRIQFLDKNAES